MISAFAAFASESSKAGRLRSGAFLVTDTNFVVLHLGVLQDRINGFIYEQRSLPS
jgi:hypothetical protein